LEDCLLAEEVLVLDSVGVAVSVKAIVKQSTPAKGFLQRGFLNPSLSVQVKPLLSLKGWLHRCRLWLLRRDGVEGTPFLLGGCITPTTEKG